MPHVPALAVTVLAALLAVLALAWLRREAAWRARLQDVRVELEQANARLEDMTTRDELTGVRTRVSFFEQVGLEWDRAAGAHQPISLVVVDVDAFGALDEAYGQEEADGALARVAACLRAAARRITDCVARTGGEEFAVLLPGTPGEGAGAFAERVRREIESLAIPSCQSPVAPVVTVSVGVSTARPRTGASPQPLLAAAQRGLRRAKASGRNRVTFESCEPAAAPASGRG